MSSNPEEFNGLKDEEVLFVSLDKPALFRVLVERYEKAFLRKAKSIVYQSEEAEDIVQDAFTKIYFHAAKFQKRPGVEFKSWAYKILVNTAITRYRKLKKKQTLEFFEPYMYEETLESSENLALAAEAKMAVSEAISRLPEKFRTLLSLYYLEDKSYKDIAEREKLSMPALKMKLFRAKRLFKKALNDNLYQ